MLSFFATSVFSARISEDNHLLKCESHDVYITIGDTVTQINDGAFWNCPSLEGFEIGRAVQTIQENAFGIYEVQKDLSGIPIYSKSVHTISVATGNAYFAVDNGILYNYDKTVLIYCPPLNPISDLEIPQTVTTIRNCAFLGQKALRTVSFAKATGLTTINSAAFAETSIYAFDLPTSITTIGDYCFYNANSAIKIPATVNSLGNLSIQISNKIVLKTVETASNHLTEENGILYLDVENIIGVADQSKTISITIPSTVLSIASGAFANYQHPITILDNSIQSIGAFAFYKADIKTITLTQTFATFGPAAFAESTLSNVSISASALVNDLPSYVFLNTKISTFSLPNNIRTMGVDVFRGTSIDLSTISGSVISSSGGIITKTSNRQRTLIQFFNSTVTAYEVPSDIIEISDYSFESAVLTKVIIGEKVTRIGRNAFTRCSNLNTITIPQGNELVVIDSSAFEGLKLTTFPFENLSVLTTIGNRVFARTYITNFNVPATVTAIGDAAFETTSDVNSTLSFSGTILTDIPYLGVNTVNLHSAVRYLSYQRGAVEPHSTTPTALNESVFFALIESVYVYTSNGFGVVACSRLGTPAQKPQEADPDSGVEEIKPVELIIPADANILGYKALEKDGFVCLKGCENIQFLAKDCLGDAITAGYAPSAIVEVTLEKVEYIADGVLSQREHPTDFLKVKVIGSGLSDSAIKTINGAVVLPYGAITSAPKFTFSSNTLYDINANGTVRTVDGARVLYLAENGTVIEEGGGAGPDPGPDAGPDANGTSRTALASEIKFSYTESNENTKIVENSLRKYSALDLSKTKMVSVPSVIVADPMENFTPPTTYCFNPVDPAMNAAQIVIDEAKTYDNAVISGGSLLSKDGTYIRPLDLNTTAETVVIPDGTIEIADSAFEGKVFRVLSIPPSLVRIGERAFKDCDIGSIVRRGATDQTGSDLGYGYANVTYIGKSAFEGCFTNTTQYPNPCDLGLVEEIGDGAFKGGNLTSIGDLTNLKILHNDALRDTKIVNITAAAGLTFIGSGNFAGQSGLLLPSSVVAEYIGESAFEGATIVSATSFISIRTVAKAAFKGMTGSNVVFASDRLTVIDDEGFMNCNFNSFTFPAVFSTLGVASFKGSSIPSTLTMTDTIVTEFPDSCFNGTRISTINFPMRITKLGPSSLSGTSLTTITLPSTITEVGAKCFEGSFQLQTVDFGDTQITALRAGTFSGTSLRTLRLPVTLTSVESNPFDGLEENSVRVIYIGCRNDALDLLTNDYPQVYSDEEEGCPYTKSEICLCISSITEECVCPEGIDMVFSNESAFIKPDPEIGNFTVYVRGSSTGRSTIALRRVFTDKDIIVLGQSGATQAIDFSQNSIPIKSLNASYVRFHTTEQITAPRLVLDTVDTVGGSYAAGNIDICMYSYSSMNALVVNSSLIDPSGNTKGKLNLTSGPNPYGGYTAFPNTTYVNQNDVFVSEFVSEVVMKDAQPTLKFGYSNVEYPAQLSSEFTQYLNASYRIVDFFDNETNVPSESEEEMSSSSEDGGEQPEGGDPSTRYNLEESESADPCSIIAEMHPGSLLELNVSASNAHVTINSSQIYTDLVLDKADVDIEFTAENQYIRVFPATLEMLMSNSLLSASNVKYALVTNNVVSQISYSGNTINVTYVIPATEEGANDTIITFEYKHDDLVIINNNTDRVLNINAVGDVYKNNQRLILLDGSKTVFNDQWRSSSFIVNTVPGSNAAVTYQSTSKPYAEEEMTEEVQRFYLTKSNPANGDPHDQDVPDRTYLATPFNNFVGSVTAVVIGSALALSVIILVIVKIVPRRYSERNDVDGAERSVLLDDGGEAEMEAMEAEPDHDYTTTFMEANRKRVVLNPVLDSDEDIF